MTQHPRPEGAPDLSRLTRSMRFYVEKLEDDLISAQAKLSAGPEDSDTFADVYSGTPRPLGRGPHIRFGGQGFEGTFDVCIEGRKLIVRGNDSGRYLSVRPGSSSMIRVTLDPPVA